MKQYTSREFSKLLRDNGFRYLRQTGSHMIFTNDMSTVSVPIHLNQMIARRLIKENKLR